jgi:hypothetical protein
LCECAAWRRHYADCPVGTESPPGPRAELFEAARTDTPGHSSVWVSAARP